eukprot:131376-Chlamydomonas_euryale.AAC.2
MPGHGFGEVCSPAPGYGDVATGAQFSQIAVVLERNSRIGAQQPFWSTTVVWRARSSGAHSPGMHTSLGGHVKCPPPLSTIPADAVHDC